MNLEKILNFYFDFMGLALLPKNSVEGPTNFKNEGFCP